MITEKQIALINGEIDGTNSPEETNRLRKALSTDEEVRVYFEDLARVNTMLASVEQVEPPRELKAAIMRAVRARAAAPAGQPAGHAADTREPAIVYDGWLNTLLAGFRHKGRWAYGLTFVAGIVAGVLGFYAFGDSPIRGDHEGMGGTMAPPAGLALVERQDVNEAGITGSVETRTGPDRTVTRLEVETGREVDIVIEYDGNLLNPIGFEQSARNPAGVAMEPGRITLMHHGRNTYVLTLGRPETTGSEVQVKFYSGGFLFQKTLKTLPDKG